VVLSPRVSFLLPVGTSEPPLLSRVAMIGVIVGATLGGLLLIAVVLVIIIVSIFVCGSKSTSSGKSKKHKNRNLYDAY